MTKFLTKIRAINLPAQRTIDRISLFFAVVFVALNLIWSTPGSLPVLMFMLAVHIFVWMAKIYQQSLYSGMAYGLILYWILWLEGVFAQYPVLSAAAVIGSFLVVFISNFSSAAASGVLSGYWILSLYIAAQNVTSLSPIDFADYVFSFWMIGEVTSHWPFLLIMGGLLWLFAVPTPASKQKLTMKLAPLLMWMNVPFAYAFLEGYMQNAEPMWQVFAGYALISYLIYRSIMRQELASAAFAYACIAFVVCYWVRMEWAIEDFYFLLYVPVIVLALVFISKFTAHMALGLVFGFWLVFFWYYLTVGTGVWVPTFVYALSLDRIFSLIKDSWPWIAVCGLLLERRWFIPLIISLLQRLRTR